MKFEAGQIIEHTALPELGRARVDMIANERLYVTFERRTGGEQKTFVLPNDGIILSKDQAGAGFESPKPAKAPSKARATKSKAPARSFDDAWARFIAKYPGGFSDAKYLTKEREPKLAVQARWKEQFGGSVKDAAAAFAAVYQKFDLLHTLEWIKFGKDLKASSAANGIVEAYAAAISAGSFDQASFERLEKAYADASVDLKWTVFTLWPYIATGKGFAFVKPLAIQAAAQSLGVALTYKPVPNFATYQGCVEVYQALEGKLQSQGAKDWFDLQSFVFIGWKD